MKDYRLYSSLDTENVYKCRALIDADALRGNYARLRRYVSRRTAPRVIAVVKADAYGHGAPACVSALLDEACDFFAVACPEEAIAVRKICRAHGHFADILILGYTDPSLAPMLAQFELIPTLLSYTHACEMQAAAKASGVRIRAHVAVDTGMNRIGFCAHDAEEICRAAEEISTVCSLPNLEIVGMFTHFACADGKDAESFARTDLQGERYRALKECLETRGVCIPFHHVCNSFGAVTREKDLFDGVRLGILLYGACTERLDVDLGLRPVMRLQANVAHIHTLLPGERVGYGGRFCARETRRIAVLPIGYADGLLRACRGALVTLHTSAGDVRVPIVGNICMDQCMLDVTDTDARVGDAVTVFGDDPHALASLARHANTIEYELLCLVSSRVPRVCRSDAFQETNYIEKE